MRRSDAVFAPSDVVAGRIRSDHGIPAATIEYAYDLDHIAGKRWEPPEGLSSESYGLYFGTLNRLKGTDRLVESLEVLLPKHPELQFVFIGSANHATDGVRFDEFIRHKCSRFGQRVRVLPAQRPATLFRYVANARFVVLPSRTDNLPNTCLEAMVLRRVVIGTRDASFDQVIHHQTNGLLVSQEDDNELIGAMESAWQMQPSRRLELGAAAYRTMDRFRPEKAVKPLIELYERVLSKRKR